MWLTRRSEINPFGQTNSVVVSIEHAIVVVHEYIADNEHIVLYLALSDSASTLFIFFFLKTMRRSLGERIIISL